MSGAKDSPTKQWTKPSQVMKVRMKRQRRSTSDLAMQPSSADRARSLRLSSASQQPSSEGRKRRNPFGCGNEGSTARRRVHTLGEIEKTDAGGHVPERQRLFSALDSTQDEVFSEEASQRVAAAIEKLKKEDLPKKKEKSATDSQDDNGESDLPSGKSYLTADWCLRTRLRFTSQKSFGWSQPIRMKEEARGLSSYVQGQNGKDTQDSPSRLQQATICWIHPNLPWLSLFPRIVPEPKKFKQSIAAKDPAIASALMTSWSESFRSAFHMLRSNHCPYFYLCTHHFTVLFRTAGMAGIPNIHALMSPTTRGLREALKNEGIDFTMPLNEGSSPPKESSGLNGEDKTISQLIQQDENALESETNRDCRENEGQENESNAVGERDEHDEDEEEDFVMKSPTKASSWLQSMGLDKTSFPSLEPSRVKFQTDPILKVDNRPQSLVLIEGPDTQALYNFLLNSRTVMTSVGPLADIPPTILSPTPFKGATLNTCKIKSGVMKQQSKISSLEEVSNLDINGPILPNNIHDLCTLLNETQDGAFQLAFNNHDATSPFTTATHTINAKSNNELCNGNQGETYGKITNDKLVELRSNCKLTESHLQYLAEECSTSVPVKEVTCKKGLYLL